MFLGFPRTKLYAKRQRGTRASGGGVDCGAEAEGVQGQAGEHSLSS